MGRASASISPVTDCPRKLGRPRLLRELATSFSQGDRSRHDCDQLHLAAQLEVKIEKNDQADTHPDIKDEIDAAAYACPYRHLRRVIRRPGEIEARSRRNN